MGKRQRALLCFLPGWWTRSNQGLSPVGGESQPGGIAGAQTGQQEAAQWAHGRRRRQRPQQREPVTGRVKAGAPASTQTQQRQWARIDKGLGTSAARQRGAHPGEEPQKRARHSHNKGAAIAARAAARLKAAACSPPTSSRPAGGQRAPERAKCRSGAPSADFPKVALVSWQQQRKPKT